MCRRKAVRQIEKKLPVKDGMRVLARSAVCVLLCGNIV